MKAKWLRRRIYAARLLITALMLAVAVAGFVVAISSVHNYPQTRVSLARYAYGQEPFWRVGFNFVNEAGSGIKYLVTGDSRHLDFFPMQGSNYQILHSTGDIVEQHSWKLLLNLSYLYALDEQSQHTADLAAKLYSMSGQRAAEVGEYSIWLENDSRAVIASLLQQISSAGVILTQLDADLRAAQNEEH